VMISRGPVATGDAQPARTAASTHIASHSPMGNSSRRKRSRQLWRNRTVSRPGAKASVTSDWYLYPGNSIVQLGN
jgi:hypothetical protein